MKTPIHAQLLTLLLLVSLTTPTIAQSDSAESEAKKPTSTSAISLTGVFEAIAASEVSATTKQLKSLVVKKVVPHGTAVKKGQNIVWFEIEAADKQLKDAERAMRLAELTMTEDEFAHKQFLATQTLDKAVATRAFQQARQTHDNFVRVDRERQIASANFSLKSSRASLNNVREELKQLEQMYKEDELTEQSEEIVLKRAKQAVESAEFRHEGVKVTASRALKQSLPQNVAKQEDALARAELAREKTVRALRAARERQEIEIKGKREKFEKTKADLKELREERKHLVIQAPRDGILFHGKFTRGKMSDTPSTLTAGATATSKQILATVVDPAKLQIRVTLTEKDLRQVSTGAQVSAAPTAYPDRSLKATVKSVSHIPFANGKFDCVLSVKLGKEKPQVMPGMGCKITLQK